MGFFLHWRKMTWVLWIWTAIFVVWTIVGIADRASKSCPPGDQLCIKASDTGTGIGVAAIVILWFLGFIVLSLIWVMTRPRHRQCPKCGGDIKRGISVCKKCGYDLAAALTQPTRLPPSDSVAESPVSSAVPIASSGLDASEALRQLDKLRAMKLISVEEYESKRRTILDRL